MTQRDCDRPAFIKIGKSESHERRKKSLENPGFGVRFDVEDLCIVRGTCSDEQQVIRYFGEYALNGETEAFVINEELVGYIRWLRDQYFVYVPDDEDCPTVEELELVESTRWLPNPSRSKGLTQGDLFGQYTELKLPPRVLTGDDFYTNPVVIRAARKTMGGIDLDPASHPVANREVQADRFYTKNDDGLSKEWFGRVWLNPPFSQWQYWVPKIGKEWASGRVQELCVLCATRTLTAQYFEPIRKSCDAFCLFHGRIRFWGGVAGDCPHDGHAVFYFGPNVDRFCSAFKEIGTAYVPRKIE